MTTPGSTRTRRREEAAGLSLRPSVPSWLALLLLLVVVWQLPLITVAAAAGAEKMDVAAAAAAAPAPDHQYVDVDGHNRILIGDDSLFGGPSFKIHSGGPSPVARLVDALTDLAEAIVGGIARVVRGVYGGFCAVWQALIKFVRDQVDMVMRFVFGVVNPSRTWKSTEVVMGFVDMTLDMAAYPGRYIVAFASSSPLGNCFHTTFHPCAKYRPDSLPTYVRCGFRVSSKCGFYDMFFRYRVPIFNDAPSPFDAAAQ